jgi:diacylglycerol kinase (ATP)
MRFSFNKQIRSFGYAFKGIYALFRTEQNAWIHLIAAVTAIISGIIFNLNTREWIWIFLAIGMVISAELFNTAIEKLVDMISPEHHKKAGLIKDLAAGAVLIAALTALLIGLGIFLPKML